MDDTDNIEWKFRELYYSSLLQQRQENETNRIKIALISIGATIASILGAIKGIQSLSVPFLSLVILIVGFVPWVYMIHVLFKKLIVDDKVIDEKISVIGTAKEFKEPPTKDKADKLNRRFHWSLTASLIGIIFISTYILINISITGEDMSKKKTTQALLLIQLLIESQCMKIRMVRTYPPSLNRGTIIQISPKRETLPQKQLQTHLLLQKTLIRILIKREIKKTVSNVNGVSVLPYLF